MEQSFATHDHSASIRSVASKKHYLASAGADDIVCLYDMRTRTENAKLDHHNGIVNSIKFTPDASHMITTSNDGSIAVIRCGNWQMEKHWLKAHGGLAVDALAIHPSGKMALTTGRDGVLRTWNLVTGRSGYATNLVPKWKFDAKYINVVKYSPDEDNFLIAVNCKIDIYSIRKGGVLKELSFDSKVICAEYLNGEFIAIGLDNGKICIYDVKNNNQIDIQAHDARVKCMAVNGKLLATGSSSGEIKLWSFEENKLKLLSEQNCGCRIICITFQTFNKLKIKKDEIIEEEKVPEKPKNTRLKQQVIIEIEDEENKKKKYKSRKDKKARKASENTDLDTKITPSKKAKTEVKKISPKRKIPEQLDSEEQNVGKKKKLNEDKKRSKEIQEINEEADESPKKKKKLNTDSLTKNAEIENKTSNKKNKRKNLQDAQQVSAKKIKVTPKKGNAPSKKKKKNFKNKMSN